MNTTSQKIFFVRMVMLLFVMLLPVTAGAETKSWALWCESNKTLYFVRDAKTYKPNIRYDGVEITNVWKIADKADKKKVSAEQKAQWVATVEKTCTTVVFDRSFSKARPLTCQDWFKGFSQLESITDIKNLNTSEVTSMNEMFKGCTSLTSIDLYKFNTAKVKNMGHMFSNCKALGTLNVSNFDTQKVTNMTSMFSGCGDLITLDLTGFSTKQLKSNKMNKMFAGCAKLKSIYVDPLEWKIKGKQKNMFKGCNSLVGETGVKMTSKLAKKDKKDSRKLAKITCLLKSGVGYPLIGPEHYIDFVINKRYKSTAREGDYVEVEVYVPEGNTLATLTAMCGKTNVKLTYIAEEDVYSFTMPKGAVTVTPTFEKLYSLSGNVSFSIDGNVVNQAMPGAEVSYKFTTPAGKLFDKLTVKQGETDVEFNDYEDGTGDFIMPAGNVTVTATFKDSPTEFAVTGDEHMTFFVNEWELEEGKKVSIGEKVIVDVEDPDGQKLDVLRVMQGETPISTALNDEGNHYFTMPAGDVTVTATYMDPYALSGGNYVEFYDDNLNVITEAFRGQKVWVDVAPDAIDANMYFVNGSYSMPEGVNLIKEEDGINYYFIMPDHDVPVTAVLTEQETLTIDLLTDDATAAINDREMANLMMQWEGYLVGLETVQNDPKNLYDYTRKIYYDFDGNGNRDVMLIETSTSESIEPTYTIQRLAGAASLGENYCLTLHSPGYPLRYKDVLFNFGKTETITGIFFYEGLNNNHTLLNYNGMTVNVSFPDRLLYKDGDWNTICLPFDLTVAGSPLDGAGVTVKTLKGASLDDEGTLTLTFTEGCETEIKAGVPYLIKWDKPAEYKTFSHEPGAVYDDLYGPTFKNVTLNTDLDPVTVDELISFEGTYTFWEYLDDAPSVLLVGAASKLYYPKHEEGNYGVVNYASLNPFRAYFQLLGGIEAVDPSLGGSIKSMVMDFGEEETTGVTSMEDGRGLMDEGWYTLQGVKLDAKPSVKGIYIYNGKKVAVQ